MGYEFLILDYDIDVISAPQFINQQIEYYCNYPGDNLWLVFLDKRLLNGVDKKHYELVTNKYLDLMYTYKLPISFYPYLNKVNTILPSTINKPNPAYNVVTRDGRNVNIVNQVSSGFLIINNKWFQQCKIRCDTRFPKMFYILDLYDKLLKHRLVPNNQYYIDIANSWGMFPSIDIDVDVNQLLLERDDFYSTIKLWPSNLNSLIDYISGRNVFR